MYCASDGSNDSQVECNDPCFILPKIQFSKGSIRLPKITAAPETYESCHQLLFEVQLLLVTWKKWHDEFKLKVHKWDDIKSWGDFCSCSGGFISKDERPCQCVSCQIFQVIFNDELEFIETLGHVKTILKHISDALFHLFLQIMPKKRLPTELWEKIWNLSKYSFDLNMPGFGTRASKTEHVLLEKERIRDVFAAAGNLHIILFDLFKHTTISSQLDVTALSVKSLLGRNISNLKVRSRRLLALDDLLSSEVFDSQITDTDKVTLAQKINEGIWILEPLENKSKEESEFEVDFILDSKPQNEIYTNHNLPFKQDIVSQKTVCFLSSVPYSPSFYKNVLPRICHSLDQDKVQINIWAWPPKEDLSEPMTFVLTEKVKHIINIPKKEYFLDFSFGITKLKNNQLVIVVLLHHTDKRQWYKKTTNNNFVWNCHQNLFDPNWRYTSSLAIYDIEKEIMINQEQEFKECVTLDGIANGRVLLRRKFNLDFYSIDSNQTIETLELEDLMENAGCKDFVEDVCDFRAKFDVNPDRKQFVIISNNLRFFQLRGYTTDCDQPSTVLTFGSTYVQDLELSPETVLMGNHLFALSRLEAKFTSLLVFDLKQSNGQGISICDIANSDNGSNEDRFISGPVLNASIDQNKFAIPSGQLILAAESDEKMFIKTCNNEKISPFLCIDFTKTSVDVAKTEARQLWLKEEEKLNKRCDNIHSVLN